MQLNTELYIQLLEQAKQNLRLRQAMDLRTTFADNSQRMLNAPILAHKFQFSPYYYIRGSNRSLWLYR